jgi:hypothetical protein
MDKLARASAHRFSKFGGWDAQEMLQYSGARGTEEFSAALAKFLSHNYGMPVHAEELMVVNGSSGGLELVCSVFARAGETVLVEEASYFLAFNIFRSHGLNVVPVRSKEGGLCVLALREAIAKHAPSMLYLIPTFSNPTGTVMTPELRREVLEACTDGGLLIVADDVYQMLHFGARPPAPIIALDAGCASIPDPSARSSAPACAWAGFTHRLTGFTSWPRDHSSKVVAVSHRSRRRTCYRCLSSGSSSSTSIFSAASMQLGAERCAKRCELMPRPVDLHSPRAGTLSG